jgi:hypothetical protein
VTPTRPAEWREMARRAGGGVEVAILLNDSLNRAKVMVSDRRLCHYVDLDVGSGDALHAFHEAFADATSRLPAGDLQAALSDRLPTGTTRKD